MAQRSALRQAVPRSSAHVPCAGATHARQRCPRDRLSCDERIRAEHRSPQHNIFQSRSLHMRTCCSHARTDPTNAPASRHLSAHTVAQQHALPTFPLLGSHAKDQSLPAFSSCRWWCFLCSISSMSLAVAVEDQHTIASRLAAARAPAPAAAAAAPAHRSLALRAASPSSRRLATL
eukprot:1971014-Prymnesium_polylepis.1